MKLFSPKGLFSLGSLSLCFMIGTIDTSSRPDKAVVFSEKSSPEKRLLLSDMSDFSAVRYAGFFSWTSGNGANEIEKDLVFDSAKIAENGNGILAGRAKPGQNIYLSSNKINIASAKSDPEGLWVAVVEKPLRRSKTLNLTSETADGHKTYKSSQKLIIELPEVAGGGASIKVVEDGQKPIILAQNLAVPAILSDVAIAAPSSKSSDNISILSKDYKEDKDGIGLVSLSGKAPKNAALKVFINEDMVGNIKADKNGDWKISEVYAIKPNSDNKLRIEQLDKNSKVVGKLDDVYKRVAQEAGQAESEPTEKQSEQKKEKTFWQKIVGMFSSTKEADSTGEEKKKQEQEQAANKTQNDAAQDNGSPSTGEQQKSGLKSGVNNSDADEEAKQAEQNKDKLKENSDLSEKKIAQQDKQQDKKASPFTSSDQASSRQNNGSAQKKKSAGSSGQAMRRNGRKRTGKRHATRKSRRKKSRRSQRRRRSVRSRSKSASRLRRSRRAAKKRHKSRRRRQALLRSRANKKRRARSRHRRRVALLRKRRAVRNTAYRRRARARKLKRYSYQRRVRRGHVARKKFYRSSRRVAAIRRRRRVKVRRGDTLWDLARIKYGHGRFYKKIYRANRKRLKNPNRIQPHQRLVLPV